MSADRSSRTTALLTAAVLAAIIAGLVVFNRLTGSEEERERHDMFSSFSPSPDGTKALYTLLGDLGFRTRRSLEALDRVEWDDTDVLVLVQPFAALDQAEVDAMLGWVEEGGTVLLAGHLLTGDPFSPLVAQDDDPLEYHFPPQQDFATVTTVTSSMTDGAETWVRGVSTTRPRLLSGVGRFASRDLFSERITETDVEPGNLTWRMGSHEVLVGEDESFVEISSMGSGRVIKIADEGLLLNRSIDRGQNLVFVLNVLEHHGGSGRVVFDEAHRAIRPGQATTVWEVLGPASEAAFLQLLLAIVVALVALGWRAAPPLPERRVTRRRALEQIESLAGMLERAGAARLAIGLLHRRTRAMWASGQLVQAAGRDRGGAARLYRELELHMTRIDAAGRATRSDLARYVQLLEKLTDGKVLR
jgi:hypothetical protein